MRWVLAACLGVWAGCSNGNAPGESCDPTLTGRECQADLVCAYSYDTCPQYGCPKCRRPCRSDAECTADDGCSPPKCVMQANVGAEPRGLCQVCNAPKPWFPP